ncbi:antibiotic biosynthesis monooxygenase family protein [Streptomyces sp. AM 2-1-1]|uniref:antibiotic biosynthesis monooxygenase family protein n=1 Tax=Streptomyces sp. AM 2-1-1 TaxID=3028709 RepID=UPI0023B8C230|nr:antibiotic biosynthesis monooxygenase family protein [Streptomyces sp. AM 2-1-1]WEH40465.1 antibiotic biosynthesis monooxygenase [Streptomyces sp. AM 2-1-1]
MNSVIVLVNVFEVRGSEAEFERAFTDLSASVRARPGFLHHRLLRPRDGSPTYINVAEWENEQSLRDALSHPEVTRRLAPLAALATGTPTICHPVLDGFPPEV